MSTINYDALKDADIEKSNESKIKPNEALRISLEDFKKYSETLKSFINKAEEKAFDKASEEANNEDKSNNYYSIYYVFSKFNVDYTQLSKKIKLSPNIASLMEDHEKFKALKNLVERIDLKGMERDEYIQYVKNTKAKIIKALDALETLGVHALKMQQYQHSMKKLLLITLLTAAFMALIIMCAPAILVAVAPAIPVAGAVKGATIGAVGVVGAEAATICHKYNQYRKKVRATSKFKKGATNVFKDLEHENNKL